MPKFKVLFTISEWGSVDIEADDEEDAKNKFWDLDDKDHYCGDSDTDIDEIICLEEETQRRLE